MSPQHLPMNPPPGPRAVSNLKYIQNKSITPTCMSPPLPSLVFSSSLLFHPPESTFTQFLPQNPSNSKVLHQPLPPFPLILKHKNQLHTVLTLTTPPAAYIHPQNPRPNIKTAGQSLVEDPSPHETLIIQGSSTSPCFLNRLICQCNS